MREFIRDFNQRKIEIEKYFELVDKIENLGISSKEIIVFPDAEYRIDNELQRILKSHCYLLLYNLIESSIRNGITAIHDIIQIEELTYKQLSTKIKKLWLLNDKSKSFVDSYIKKETVADNLKAIIETVLTNKKIDLASSNIPISGNLDAETITKLIDMYGFHGNLGIPRKEIDEILNFIVKVRCDLAHGNFSFSEASKQITWEKIVNDKDKLIKYLTHLLNNIDEYIENNKYKKDD